MGIKIWERYFLGQFGMIFLLFFFCFYGLYVLIDYASNASSFHHYIQFQWKQTIFYYLCELARRLDVLLPMSLMIALIRTLCNLNVHNELVALLSGGFSLQTLMRPFIIAGLLSTGLIYLNMEFILPYASKELKQIYDSRSREKHKNQQKANAMHLVLVDNSTMLFNHYDSSLNRFQDAYWIRDVDNIYRMKYLTPNNEISQVPEGKYVEHLKRNDQGELSKIASYQSLSLPEMKFNKKILFETITMPIEQSISNLWDKLPKQQETLSEREAQILSAFYYKLVMPWLCLLAIIAPAPSCLRCTRQLPIFLIYACSIFGLVAFYLIMDAALLLGERHLFPPALSIGIPFGLFVTILTWRYFKKI